MCAVSKQHSLCWKKNMLISLGCKQVNLLFWWVSGFNLIALPSWLIQDCSHERIHCGRRSPYVLWHKQALLWFPLQTCLSIPDIKTAFSDCINKIGKRDCLTQACSALTGWVWEGVDWELVDWAAVGCHTQSSTTWVIKPWKGAVLPSSTDRHVFRILRLAPAL